MDGYLVLNTLNLTILSLLLDFNFLVNFKFFHTELISIVFYCCLVVCNIFHRKAPWGLEINVCTYVYNIINPGEISN